MNAELGELPTKLSQVEAEAIKTLGAYKSLADTADSAITTLLPTAEIGLWCFAAAFAAVAVFYLAKFLREIPKSI